MSIATIDGPYGQKTMGNQFPRKTLDFKEPEIWPPDSHPCDNVACRRWQENVCMNNIIHNLLELINETEN